MTWQAEFLCYNEVDLMSWLHSQLKFYKDGDFIETDYWYDRNGL